MHPATVLFLVCVSTVYAEKYHLRHEDKHYFYPPSSASQNLHWPSNSVAPWDAQTETTSSSEEVHLRQNESEEPELDLPQPWIAPPFKQALHNYDEAVVEITRHFGLYTGSERDDNKIRYIAIAQAVDLLSKTVAEEGWTAYERNYENIVQQALDDAVLDPQGAIRRLECTIFAQANKKLHKIRKVIDNTMVKFLCRKKPSACDAVIFAALKLVSDNELEHDLSLLMSLGHAASTFMRFYANSFDEVSKQDDTLYLYLLKAKDVLRTLVAKNAIARQMLHPVESMC